MSLKTRLEKALEVNPGVTKADLARACRVKASSVSDWFSGETKSLKSLSLLHAAARLNVHALWLATGEGPMSPGIAYAAAPPPTSFLARESSAEHWPFRYITPGRWAPLPPLDKARIETFADATLQAWEAHHADKSNGTTG